MLPRGYKVGSVTPPAPKPPSAASVAGAKVAAGAKAAGGAIGAGAKAAGASVASGAQGAAHTAKFLAKNPSAVVKAPAAAVSNAYKKTFNDPAKPGAKATMMSNLQRGPVSSATKVAAGVTGVLAPLAAAKGLAKPANALRTHQAMKQDAADKKKGDLNWSPAARTNATKPRG